MNFPNKMNAFKWHTLIKGLIWEAIGVLILFVYAWATTGSVHTAASIGLVYPAIRFGLWYPYERIYKRIRRRNIEYNAYMLLTAKKEHDTTIVQRTLSRLATNGITRGHEHIGESEITRDAAFLVSRELLEKARNEPITAQWIRDRMEEEITGKKKYTLAASVRGVQIDFEKPIPMQPVKRMPLRPAAIQRIEDININDTKCDE